MNERRWFILSVIFWALFVIYILGSTARFEIGRHTDPPAVEESGRLPGDDIPAEISCRIPDEVAVAEIIAEEEAENERIEQALIDRAHRIEKCKITHYCTENYKHICNDGDATRTASGAAPQPYVTCAADDIPIGSTVMILDQDGNVDRYLVCADRFGGSQKNHIDICVPTHQEALERGWYYATVLWCEEE